MTKIDGTGYGAGAYWLDTITTTKVEQIQFTDKTVSLTTSDESIIEGTSRNDTLSGTSGDDFFDSKGGDDTIDGGGGTDTLLIFEASDDFEITSPFNVTRFTGKWTAGDYAYDTSYVLNLEKISFTDIDINISATPENFILGTYRSDYLTGTTKDEIFDGWDGDDTIDGKLGYDRLVVHANSDNFSISQTSFNSFSLEGNYSSGSYAYNEIKLIDVEEIVFLNESIQILKPNIIINPKSGAVSEDDTNWFDLDVQLTVAPKANVTIKIITDSDILAQSESIQFTPDNWNEVQSFRIMADDDKIVENNEVKAINFRIISGDLDYKLLEIEPVQISIEDNDTAFTNKISGKIWRDTNHNQTINEDEEFLSDWGVYLDKNNNLNFDEGELHTLTNINGEYHFTNVETGDYNVRQIMQNGYSQTTPRNQFENFRPDNIDNLTIDENIQLEDVAETSLDENYHQKYQELISLDDILEGGYDGSGFSVAILDTGIDLDHSHFGSDSDGNGISDRIKVALDFTGGKPSGDDGNGHGTHVSGIIGGSDAELPGIAPGVNLISLKVLSDSGSGSFSSINKALDWCIENAEKYNLVAINMSLGDGSFAEEDILDGYSSVELAALEALGVCVVSASGNGYSSKAGVSYPSSDVSSWSIGANFHSDIGSLYGAQTSGADVIVPFSQRDDELTTVFAPGVKIPAAKAGGGVVQYSGTSMAAPVIAGAVAVIQDAASELLGLKLTPDEVRDLITTLGDKIIDGDDENDNVTNTDLEFPRINMKNIIDELTAMAGPGGYKISVLDNDVVTDLNFGVDATSVDNLSFNNKIVGSAGADIISLNSQDIKYYGGLGNDTLIFESETVEVSGGSGDDTFIVNKIEQLEKMTGGSGFDTLDLSHLTIGADINLSDYLDINVESVKLSDVGQNLTASSGLHVAGISGNHNLNLGQFSDFVVLGGGSNLISLGGGDDTVRLESDSSWAPGFFAKNTTSSLQVGTNQMIELYGKAKYEGIFDGGDGADNIILGSKNDAFFLHDAFSEFHGDISLLKDFRNMSSIERLNSVETISGGDGNDVIDLTSPDYSMLGQSISINGDDGDDILWGSAADEIINGGSGNDTLFGGAGINMLTGGVGADVFQLTWSSQETKITDFNFTEGDKLALYNSTGINFDKNSIQLTNNGFKISEGNNNFLEIELVATSSGLNFDLEDLSTAIEII